VLPTHNHPQKIYSEAVIRQAELKFLLTVKSKEIKTPEEIKSLLKTQVNPTEIKVGITSIKPLRDGRIIIEAGSKDEIEKLGEQIGEKCGDELEVKIQRLRNPRLVMLSIPEEVTMENVRETLMKQNPEINLNDRMLEHKFCYTTKRGNRNLVIELDSSTRIELLQTTVKMGWTVCKLDDYIAAKRRFRCSRYNHIRQYAKGN